MVQKIFLQLILKNFLRIAISKRPKWKIFSRFSLSNKDIRFGEFCFLKLVSNFTIWHSPFPDEIWTKHNLSLKSESPVVSVSIAIEFPNFKLSGKSLL